MEEATAELEVTRSQLQVAKRKIFDRLRKVKGATHVKIKQKQPARQEGQQGKVKNAQRRAAYSKTKAGILKEEVSNLEGKCTYLEKDVGEAQKIVGTVMQEKQVLESTIQQLRENDSDTEAPAATTNNGEKVVKKVKARYRLMEKNRYKNTARMLCWKILPHVSVVKCKHILKACLQFVGAENQQLPSDRQLARFIVEMKHLARLCHW
mmetsp:Transcript_9367/g.18712  ORF Transcript_9367/g.18712 Transcript_9367/m.18712 type:complete len:208 (+) Transcript_9367:437-1060(+)